MKIMCGDGIRQPLTRCRAKLRDRPARRMQEEDTVMLELFMAGATGAVTLFGYLKARQFVRERLRFVESAQRPAAALAAGVGAAALATPVVLLLPVVGLPSAVIFGIGVGWGVHHGARDVHKRLPGN
jgi:hypothetical protein